MQRSGVITLLTDFGDQDPFAGVMHGVILRRFIEARIVDLTHQIAPQQVSQGAFWLERAHRWFPAGTVHVAVIDPGVGTSRAIIAANVDDHIFLAPDNGLLGAVLEDASRSRIVRVDLDDLKKLDIEHWSTTFHGRDIFAPLAAELASGRVRLRQLGPVIEAKDLVASALPRAVDSGDRLEGVVAVVDRFGNLISNVPGEWVRRFDAPSVRIRDRVVPVHKTYGDAAAGALVALVSSFDRLEIACAGGSAASVLGAGAGEAVLLY